MPSQSTNRLIFFGCLLFAATMGTNGSTLHDNHKSRRRRRSKDDSANDQKNAELLKGIMEEVLILRKQVRDSSKETQELKGELEALKKTKGNSLPFEVDESSKTVTLKNWNLHIEADSASPNAGNLIVGTGHGYEEAKNSFFSGHGHAGSGNGIVIVGGLKNSVSGNSSAIFAGISNKVIGSYNGIVVGGGGNTVEKASFGAILAGGSNRINHTSMSTIVGGHNNRVEYGHGEAVLAGNGHTVSGGQYSVAVGGALHNIKSSYNSIILGGSGHRISKSLYSIISGGTGNFLNTTTNCHASGGSANHIRLSASSTITGGRRNFIGGNNYMKGLRAQMSVIAGGDGNEVFEHSKFVGAKNQWNKTNSEPMDSLFSEKGIEHDVEVMAAASKKVMEEAEALGEWEFEEWEVKQ